MVCYRLKSNTKKGINRNYKINEQIYAPTNILHKIRMAIHLPIPITCIWHIGQLV